MTASVGDRLSALRSPSSRLCVGIDPHPSLLRDWGLPDSADGALSLGRSVLEAVTEAGVHIVKPQVALFERHGVAGMSALSTLLHTARERGVVTIADAKRGDVGSTVVGYADAWLRPGSDFDADAVTAVAYQGVGSLEPLFEAAEQYQRLVFVLVATSNPEGWPVQSARVSDSGYTVARQTLEVLTLRQKLGPTTAIVGAVVGATVDQDALGLGEEVLHDSGVPVLAPGYGFQGARLSDISAHFGAAAGQVIPTVSRSIVQGGPSSLVAALSGHLAEVA